jgi:hypothetical protein
VKTAFMRKPNRFPTRFPPGSKYVLESRGPMVHRYVELPNGRRVTLPARKAATCCAADVSLVPNLDTEKKVRAKSSRPRVHAEF